MFGDIIAQAFCRLRAAVASCRSTRGPDAKWVVTLEFIAEQFRLFEATHSQPTKMERSRNLDEEERRDGIRWGIRPMEHADIDKCLAIWSQVELTEANKR